MTIAALLLIVQNAAGWIYAHWRWVAIGIIAVAVLAFGLWLRGCAERRHAKLETQQIEAAKKAIADDDRKAMIDKKAEWDAADAAINAEQENAKVAAVNAATDSRKESEGMTNQELADLLNERAKK